MALNALILHTYVLGYKLELAEQPSGACLIGKSPRAAHLGVVPAFALLAVKVEKDIAWLE